MDGAGDIVLSVAISSDGQYIAAGGMDNKTNLFDKDISSPLWSYTTGGWVYSVTISPDGQYIAAGGRDHKVYLFDNSSSTPLWNYTTGDNVYSVAISSNGQYIAAGSFDDKVYLFENTSSTPLWNYTTEDNVYSVAISSDGQYIAAGGYDDNVYLFDKASSTPLWIYTTGNTVHSVAISSDGQLIAAGGYDYKVYLFDNEPYPFTLSTDANDFDIDGIFFLNWTVSSGATNYSVYRYSSYINEINGSLTLLADEITDLSLYLSGYLDGPYYFIVVARNDYGETLSNCIMVEGLPPANFVLSSNAGDPDDDGLFTLSWTTSLRAANYSVYQFPSFITAINDSLTLLTDEITDLSLDLSGYLDGPYYFIVVAHNQMGNTSSNCISVIVQITKSITNITPDISSLWECGTSQLISWSSTGNISNIKIELYRNDVFVMEIISSTANDGEVYWVCSSELLSSDHYQIKIIDLSDASMFAYSDYFEIENTSPTEPPGIPGYNVLFLIATLGSIIALILKKRSESKK
jgi:WD40 repeat protein